MNVKEKMIKELEKKYEKEREERKGEYHVSEIIYCLRKMYLQRKEKEKIEEEKMLIFEAGRTVEKWVKEILKKEEIEEEKRVEYEIEEKGKEKIKIVGHIDLFYKNTPIEIKSTKNLAYMPTNEHIEQLNCYINMSGTEKGILLYVEKNTYEIMEVEVRKDEKRFKEIIERAKKIDKAIKEKSVPEAEKNWLCRFCEKKELCKKIEKK